MDYNTADVLKTLIGGITLCGVFWAAAVSVRWQGLFVAGDSEQAIAKEDDDSDDADEGEEDDEEGAKRPYQMIWWILLILLGLIATGFGAGAGFATFQMLWQIVLS